MFHEAAVGGPIALVEEGDIIKIDIPNMKLELDVSDEVLAERKAKWQPREPKVTTGYLKRYAALVTSRKQRSHPCTSGRAERVV